MSYRKRFLALALLLLIALSPACALAEKAIVVKSARAYEEPDAASRSVKVSAGTILTLVAERDGVAMVQKGNVTAYMPSSALEKIVEYGGKAVYVSQDCALRRAASASAKAQKALFAGEEVSLIATVADWAYIQSGSKKGYVPVSRLSAEKPQAGTNSAPELPSIPGYVALDGAKIYASRSTNARALATLRLNDEVAVYQVKNSWCIVKYGETAGYMPQKALSASRVSESSASPVEGLKTVTAYVQKDGAKVYPSPSAESEARASLNRNDTVAVSAVKGQWCAVVAGDELLYMRKSDLGARPAPVVAYVKNDGARAYKKPNKNSGSVALPVNTQLTVAAANDSWAQVKRGGTTAYMLLSDLSETPVEVSDAAAPVAAYVKTHGAKAYAAASSSANVLATLHLNAEVLVVAAENGWAAVKSGQTTAYMLLEDLSSEKLPLTSITAYVKNEGAKVYASPATSAKALATGAINDKVTVVLVRDGWAAISLSGGYAYMLAADLSETPVEAAQVALRYGDQGEAVEKLQKRLKELGYFAGTVGGNYLQLTQSAVSAFQSAAKITATGVADAQTIAALFSDGAPQKTAASSGGSSNAGYSSAAPATGKARGMDWWDSDIQKIFSRNTVAKVTDVATGISWYVIRKGGTNHADVQPLTAADTNSMKKACGGKWSWQRRAIFVTIDGVNYAASMNCMPHGSGSIKDNNFDGHHCIHFTNSRTHGGNRVCPQHQSAIKKALAATL